MDDIAPADVPELTGDEDLSQSAKPQFNEDMIKKYPKANRKVPIEVVRFGINPGSTDQEKGQSLHISPHGLEFQGTKAYPAGTLLKINITLPDYWTRKQKLVEYRRIDAPGQFKILAKVVRADNVGKRGKKKLILAQTVNMDEVDEQVLKAFLQE
jgi:hypothetical protein